MLANMSVSGMFFRLNRRMEVGEPVFVLVKLSTKPLKDGTTPRIAANGAVVRVEPKTDGTYGVAVQLQHHRFP